MKAKNFSSSEPCLCCGIEGANIVCYHHILTQGAHPELIHDVRNKAPVCKPHHNDWHIYGTTKMANMYVGVRKFLINNGWDYSPFYKKWSLYEKEV